MNRRAITAIVRKDLGVVVQSKAVTIPLMIVPLVFFVGLPLLAGLGGPALVNVPGGTEQFMANLPEGLRATLNGLDEAQQLVVLLLVYFFAPMFLIVPLMVATVIAADSFAGEKERKTLEALLYSPVSDRELFVAKLLSAWLPFLLGVGLWGITALLLWYGSKGFRRSEMIAQL